MPPAIRTVMEDDNVHVIEGYGIRYGGPFPGNSDSYATRATAKTDFYWDLFPDRRPTDPDDVPARFTRPATYEHGFDKAVGLRRIGGWSPMRADKKGVWIQAQLDKHDEYYAALRELLDADALGFSPASVEHAARIGKNGDWIDWPMFELALTPTPSNPLAQIAVRTGDFMVRITGLRATDKSGKAVGPPEGGKEREDIPAEDFAGKDKSYPIVTPASVSDAASSIGRAGEGNYSSDELKANIIKIAKRKGPEFEAALPDAWKEPARSAFRSAADDVSCASSIQSQLAYLMGCESDEADQLAKLKAAFDAVGEFITAESAEIGTEADEPEDVPLPPVAYAYMSAMRQGRRNAASDLALIDGVHDATVALGATAHLGDNPPNDETHQEPGPERSAEAQTRKERANAKAVRKALKRASQLGTTIGAETGAQEALRLLG